MTSPEYQAPTWVDEDDPDFVEGVSPDLGAGYLNALSGAVEDHGQRLGAAESDVTNLQATALDQAGGDARYILQSNAAGFAPAEATASALAGKQSLDADLTALAGLDSATAGTVASDGAGWVKKTYAQLRTALGLATIATSGKLADATDVTTTGAAVGDLLSVSGVGPLAVGKKSPADLPISAATQNAFDRSLIYNARVQVDPEAYDYFDREVVTCTVPTYDGSNVVVHPSVLYFAEGWNGYRYWMSFTPYPGQQSAYENPSIVVSDDGTTWVVPPGLTNPIVPDPGGGVYNSDSHLAWGPDNRLYMIYRTTFPSGTDSYYYMSSADGVTWTAPIKMFDLDRTVESLLSPCVWYDRAAKEWVMLGIDMVPNPRVMRRRTATSLTAWAASTAVTMNPAAWESGKDMWHMDAKPVGNQVIALISDNTAGGSSGQGGLYFAVSNDRGKTFRRSTLKLGTDAGLNKYRSSFWPMLREDGLGFDVWVGTISSVTRVATRRRRDPLGEHAKTLGAATGGTYPFIAGDSFNRADSTTGVGNADSGQAWTTLNGAPGVIGKQAYASTAVNTRAVLDVGAADVEVSALITMTTTGQAWLMARAADNANYIRFGRLNSSSFRWEQIVAGATAATGTSLILDPAPPNLFTIRCKGSRVQFLLNGVLIEEASLTAGATNTKVGLQADNISARFDALTVRVPA